MRPWNAFLRHNAAFMIADTIVNICAPVLMLLHLLQRLSTKKRVRRRVASISFFASQRRFISVTVPGMPSDSPVHLTPRLQRMHCPKALTTAIRQQNQCTLSPAPIPQA
ncbi:hypothetical protein KCP71_21005 [Salmonella enterica subsp. enterica]|nr:hypothetical protein KCP71_21005 [Salmonella enterica subsp. enterica]